MVTSVNHEAEDLCGRFQDGFTLLELLVALSIFVVLSLMAYQGLSNMLMTRDIIEEKTQNLHELQMVFMLLGNDLEQAVARPVIGESGQMESAFMGGEQTSAWLILTQGGRPNPRGEARSEFQRVAWLFEEGTLIRRTWKVLDAMGENPHTDETLVTDVLNLEVGFVDNQGVKSVIWPSQESHAIASVSLPRAVEVFVEKKGMGRIRRVFELPLTP
ncbi:MAG: type II secretion system minor pseudopilin GspJ [Magnetococcus sp. THC-1_WYH]